MTPDPDPNTALDAPVGLPADAAARLFRDGRTRTGAHPTAFATASGPPPERPRVAVVMPVRNEAAHLAASLGSVLAQRWPHDRLDVYVVDGNSDDRTTALAEEIARDAAARGRSPTVRVLRNPAGNAAAGLNVGIAAARGGAAPPDVVVRVDGHAALAPDFVERAVETLADSGADAVGGPIETLPPHGSGASGRAVALAMSSAFGAGNAAFRTGAAAARDVDTVAFAAYRRDALDRLGGFDESFPRNQDDEFHLRLTRSGGRIRLDPTIRAAYRCRPGPAAAARQYFGYGFHKARLLRRHGRLPTLRGLAPPALVLAMIGAAAIAAVTSDVRWLLAIAGPYALAAVAAAGVAILRTSRRPRATSTTGEDDHAQPDVSPAATLAWLPVAYAALHFGYGAGFLCGVPAAILRPPVPRVPRLATTPTAPDRADRLDRAIDARLAAERSRLAHVYTLRDADPSVAARDSDDDAGHAWLVADRERRLRSLLRDEGIDGLGDGPHLDVGCGRGTSIALLRRLGARGRIVGLDALPSRIAAVRDDARPDSTSDAAPRPALLCGDAARLPVFDGACGSALLATVASSIADGEVRRRAAREALRVLRPGGVVVWYDLRVRGRTTAAVRAATLRALFPGCRVAVHSAGLLPPLARAAARVSPRLCDLLALAPPLRTHLVAVVRRADDVPTEVVARGALSRRVAAIAFALPSLMIAAPVIALLAIVVRVTSPGPAFHRSPRVGRGGRTFTMFKLRSMRVAGTSASTSANAPLTAPDDPRITRVGAFLRRTRLDELPQLWNVLRGDMAIVGPRPESPLFVDVAAPRWRTVLAVRPGITGPAQLAFAHRETRRLGGGEPEATYRSTLLPRKLRIDATYVVRRTLLTDFGWMARTVATVSRRALRLGTGR